MKTHWCVASFFLQRGGRGVGYHSGVHGHHAHLHVTTTQKLIYSHKDALHAVSAALLEKEMLSGEELAQILAEHPPNADKAPPLPEDVRRQLVCAVDLCIHILSYWSH